MNKDRIKQLLGQLNERVYEKEHVIALSLLSAIAGESIFLLGPPGVAKSMVARRLKLAFRGAKAFEYLMSRFSTPDEIFGPVSISKLKDEDTYERMVEGYLPTADVVFLDEIWKAGPAIQNALLTVINEKIYRNGLFSLQVPLKGLIAASNELPAIGQGLEALWDRFLIRLMVTGVEDMGEFDRMIASSDESDPWIDDALNITPEEYATWADEIPQVRIHYSIFEVIHILKDSIELFNQRIQNDGNAMATLYVSDRRALCRLIEGYADRVLLDEPEVMAEELSVDRTMSLIDAFLGTLPEELGGSASLVPDAVGDYASRFLMEDEKSQTLPTMLEEPAQEAGDSVLRALELMSQKGADAVPEAPVAEVPLVDEESLDESYFTETLAKIYIKQRKYSRALEIIRTLYLQFPEKNTYFADQIRFLEKLIINNNLK
jgi:MoxR-like ATPase